MIFGVGLGAVRWTMAFIVVVLAAVGCSTEAKDRSSVQRLGPFRQITVERCLTKERIIFAYVRPRDKVGRDVRRKFPGVTGAIDMHSGTAGIINGPPIDAGHLVFEQTAAQARHDVAGLYDSTYHTNPLNPPAPKDVQPSLQSTRGNVVILWDYPTHRHALSIRLVEKCLPG
ncbi:MAG TPA: hypothetical protein VFJ93_06890 [Gaiellaceae bacterium]|jgi:hypothetical protein|nr:hypothetical protein [Gaiellaceae bacterium]